MIGWLRRRGKRQRQRGFRRAVRAAEQAADAAPGLASGGLAASRALHHAVLRQGESGRRVADALHGTWLGHPLHPVLTDITIGAWLMGALFDVSGELTDSDAARRAGDTLAGVGTAAAAPVIASGLADFSTVPRRAAATATLHGLLNSGNVVLYLMSLRERRRGNRKRGLFFSSVGLAATMASAWLGGELIYRHRVGVSHAEDLPRLESWTPVCGDHELREGEPKRVDIAGHGVLLVRRGNDIYAVGASCSHDGARLDHGRIQDCRVECPRHHSVFDVRTGEVVHGPATQRLPRLEAREHEGYVELRSAR